MRKGTNNKCFAIKNNITAMEKTKPRTKLFLETQSYSTFTKKTTIINIYNNK